MARMNTVGMRNRKREARRRRLHMRIAFGVAPKLVDAFELLKHRIPNEIGPHSLEWWRELYRRIPKRYRHHRLNQIGPARMAEADRVRWLSEMERMDLFLEHIKHHMTAAGAGPNAIMRGES